MRSQHAAARGTGSASQFHPPRLACLLRRSWFPPSPGAKAIYLSGSGVATASYGLPDLGITTMDNVVEDVKRITGACALPLVVDIDTGFGSAFNMARTVRRGEQHATGTAMQRKGNELKRLSIRPSADCVGTGSVAVLVCL